jgi:hypothetical protein
MATVSDLNTTTLSGLNHIDALLDTGPDWNYLTPVGNTLAYTFSITSGNEGGKTGQEAFTLAQQAAVRGAFDYISKITGIVFTETAVGSNAQIHLCNIDLAGGTTTGLCSWASSYSYDYATSQLVSYDADAWVYLDSVEWRAMNHDLAPGGNGYETLLHELGHALGLKHPFDDSIHLPAAQDNTTNTLMSYTDSGGPHALYGQYDIAALKWIYGGDGLRGALGINSTTGARYFTGTSATDTLNGTQFNDTLEGDGGNDMIYGGDGTDTAVFLGARSDYTITALANGDLRVATNGSDGADTLDSVEILQFSNGSYQRADVIDTTPPLAPTLNVTKNAAGYASGNTPQVTGEAEANSTVKVYSGDNLLGTATADANGFWSLVTTPFADGVDYSVYAKATDGAGNTSTASGYVFFNIDAHAPTVPTNAVVVPPPDGNQPTFSGTAEANTTIQLVRITDGTEIGRTTAAADGTWAINSHPLPNGDYSVRAVSVDVADNATSSSTTMTFNIASSLNMTGDANANSFTPGLGNNAIDGQAGIDTAIYNSARANFTVSKDVWGHSVVDNVGAGGHDSLMNVERIQFSDAWLALDVDGVAGEAFRLYQAAFDRPAEAAGLGYWIWRMEGGTSLTDVANEFTKQPEFYSLYGSNSTDSEFVGHLYNNVLHRPAEGAGFDYWMNVLATHGATRAQVLSFFSESPENQAQVVGSIQDGMAFTPWHG